MTVLMEGQLEGLERRSDKFSRLMAISYQLLYLEHYEAWANLLMKQSFEPVQNSSAILHGREVKQRPIYFLSYSGRKAFWAATVTESIKF